MGFLADWRAHWKWMGLELRSLFHTLVHHPCRSLRTALTHPLLAALAFFLVAMYFNGVSSVQTERRGFAVNQPLKDYLHDAFPEYDSYDFSNYLLYATVAATAVRFLPIWPCTKPAIARMIFRRWLFLEAVIFCFRAVSVVVTSYPSPDDDCVSTATDNVWWEGLRINFGVTHTCGDCMFSGHTAAITLLVMFWTHYSRGEEFAICFGNRRGVITSNVDAAGDPIGVKLTDVLAWAWAIFCYYWILATRFHYTADVVMGFVVTWLLFHAYHFYLKVLPMRQGSLFSRFMRWFEGIDVAARDTLRERAAVLTTTGGHADPLQAALHAGREMTKDNAVLGGKDLPVAALPTSYLEGGNYWRPPGGEHQAEAAQAQDQAQAGVRFREAKPASDAYYAKDAALPPTAMGGYEKELEEGRGRAHDGAAAAGPYEQATSLHGPGPAAAAATAAAPGVQHPPHNAYLPMAVLVPGETAEQERRTMQREQAGRF